MAADKEATYTGNEMPYMTDKEATYTGKNMPYMADKDNAPSVERRLFNEDEEEEDESQLHWEGDALYESRQRSHLH